jgi:hypothetical protein
LLRFISTYWHMHTLYTAETLAGNAKGAWLHAGMLHRVLVRQSEREAGTMDLTYLRYLIYNESAACCMFMTRPILDYDSWVPEMFRVLPLDQSQGRTVWAQLGHDNRALPVVDARPLH